MATENPPCGFSLPGPAVSRQPRRAIRSGRGPHVGRPCRKVTRVPCQRWQSCPGRPGRWSRASVPDPAAAPLQKLAEGEGRAHTFCEFNRRLEYEGPRRRAARRRPGADAGAPQRSSTTSCPRCWPAGGGEASPPTPGHRSSERQIGSSGPLRLRGEAVSFCPLSVGFARP